jgi:hypothetical protein
MGRWPIQTGKDFSMSADATILNRLDTMTVSIDTLGRGLILMTETLATHSEILGEILEACSAEPRESPLTEALKQIVAAINDQNETLVGISATLENIGSGIEDAVVRGFHRASGTVDDDGVVQE